MGNVWTRTVLNGFLSLPFLFWAMDWLTFEATSMLYLVLILLAVLDGDADD